MRYKLEVHGPRGELISTERGLELSQILAVICNRAGKIDGYILISQERE